MNHMIELQRAMAINLMGKKAAELHREGYDTDADRVLDAILDRQQSWTESGSVDVDRIKEWDLNWWLV